MQFSNHLGLVLTTAIGGEGGEAVRKLTGGEFSGSSQEARILNSHVLHQFETSSKPSVLDSEGFWGFRGVRDVQVWTLRPCTCVSYIEACVGLNSGIFQEAFRRFSGSFQETLRKVSESFQETFRKLTGSQAIFS